MTTDTTSPTLSEQRERVEEPAKRWRNWWRYTVHGVTQAGKKISPGKVGCGPNVWPSKDIAETRVPPKTARATFVATVVCTVNTSAPFQKDSGHDMAPD